LFQLRFSLVIVGVAKKKEPKPIEEEEEDN